MKKIFFMTTALAAAMAFTSCRSSESAYKKAYEKAQAAQNQNQQYTQNNVQYGYGQQSTPVEVTPVSPTTTTTTVATTPATTTTVTTTPTTTVPVQQKVDYSNVTVRTEKAEVVSGSALKEYSVVVGSFSVKANAEGLKSKLANAGYSSRVIRTQVNGADWYRVVAASFSTKDEAAAFRASQQANYPDAWLLYAK